MTSLQDIEPFPLPETQPYWDGLARGELSIQRCVDCDDFYFPPSPVCPRCSRRKVEWFSVSGRGRLYSYVIAERAWPQWGRSGATSVALVELEEGPRLVSTVVDCPQTPEYLVLDMRVRAVFRPFGDRTMLCFAPFIGEEPTP